MLKIFKRTSNLWLPRFRMGIKKVQDINKILSSKWMVWMMGCIRLASWFIVSWLGRKTEVCISHIILICLLPQTTTLSSSPIGKSPSPMHARAHLHVWPHPHYRSPHCLQWDWDGGTYHICEGETHQLSIFCPKQVLSQHIILTQFSLLNHKMQAYNCNVY